MVLKQVTFHDDLAAICAQITLNSWGKDNEMTQYDEGLLRDYLADEDHVLVLAYDDAQIAGVALCYILPHPSKGDTSLYVHELDTHPDYRRQGVATQLMKEVFSIAKQRGINEVWLGADSDNEAANRLYQTLSPSETDPTITYTYSV